MIVRQNLQCIMVLDWKCSIENRHISLISGVTFRLFVDKHVRAREIFGRLEGGVFGEAAWLAWDDCVCFEGQAAGAPILGEGPQRQCECESESDSVAES